MSVHISNLTTRPVWLTLTSGQTVRLSPGETSTALHEGEVKDNAKVQRLIAQRVVALGHASGGSTNHHPPKTDLDPLKPKKRTPSH